MAIDKDEGSPAMREAQRFQQEREESLAKLHELLSGPNQCCSCCCSDNSYDELRSAVKEALKYLGAAK